MEFIQSVEQYQSLTQAESATVVIFTADWCSDCRYLDLFIEDVAKAYAEKYAFYKIDRDQFAELCDTLDVLGIPSFLVYQRGEVIGRFVNGKRKTKVEVETFLDEVLTKVQPAHS
jgi:thiol-disulfide isomerase/thioredoxin